MIPENAIIDRFVLGMISLFLVLVCYFVEKVLGN